MLKLYTINQIKKAFWATFNETGELCFVGSDEENRAIINQVWTDFTEALEVNMDKKVKELIVATGAWVAVCMKQYPDSRFVDDKLVRVCAALSAFESDEEKDPNEEKNWITEATTMFHKYVKESNRQDLKELTLIYAGKATGLHELLSKFGVAPKATHITDLEFFKSH